MCWKRIRVSPKLRVLSSRTFTQTLDFENFATARRSSAVLSTYVNCSVIKWWRSSVTHQFITLTVHTCTARWAWITASRGSVSGSGDLLWQWQWCYSFNLPFISLLRFFVAMFWEAGEHLSFVRSSDGRVWDVASRVHRHLPPFSGVIVRKSMFHLCTLSPYNRSR